MASQPPCSLCGKELTHNCGEDDHLLNGSVFSGKPRVIPFDPKLPTIQKNFYYRDFFASKFEDSELRRLKVAIFDSGIQHDHPEFVENSVTNLLQTEMEDHLGHGTHVAGIIAGEKVGLAFGVELFVAKVTGHSGLELKLVKAAFDAAIAAKVDFINFSAGVFETSDPICDELEQLIIEATLKDIVVIVAGGNEGSLRGQNIAFPASCGSVIRVGGHSKKGNALPLSSVGYPVHISALAKDVFSASINGGYGLMTGTSTAAPFVTAICCLVQTLATIHGFGRLGMHTFKHLFRTLCFNLRDDPALGQGLIQLDRILEMGDYFLNLLEETV